MGSFVNSVPSAFQLPLIQIFPDSNKPLYQQIYEAFQRAILDKKLAANTKLPSHRDLSEMLGVSRNTLVNALDQLVAEGYLVTRVGAGTFVAGQLPEFSIQAPKDQNSATQSKVQRRVLSRFGQSLMSQYNPHWYLSKPLAKHNLFRSALPDQARFPFKVWDKINRKYLLDQPAAIFDFNPDPRGYGPLREALADYLQVARAVQCDADQIVMLAGTEQMAYLAARILLEPGDMAWVEEPGFPGAARAFTAAGATIVPIPVDGQGLNFDAATEIAPQAKLAYVTPSHHFPTGSTMSLQRRLELLLWAKSRNFWIIEDDYDSEFRYHGRPLPSLQGLNAYGRVIYCGTFNNVLFPGLRLDYAVLPHELIEPMLAARTTLDIHIATVNQAIIADFIQEGHFIRHIRRMRKHYAQRKDALVSALQEQSDGLIEIGNSNGGMHICVWLPDHIDDEQVHLAAAAEGIQVVPLSRFYRKQPKRMGLVLGFTACAEEDLYAGVAELVRIIKSSQVTFAEVRRA